LLFDPALHIGVGLNLQQLAHLLRRRLGRGVRTNRDNSQSDKQEQQPQDAHVGVRQRWERGRADTF